MKVETLQEYAQVGPWLLDNFRPIFDATLFCSIRWKSVFL